MKISAFYENIRTGAEFWDVTMTEAVSMLRDSGLTGLYISLDSLKSYLPEIKAVLVNTEVSVEGLHAWIDLGTNPEGYRELIDAACNMSTDNVLIVPICSGEHDSDLMETLLSGMKAAVEYGQSRGITVCMEDMDRLDSPYNCVAGLDQFLSEISGLCCCFDTRNFIMFQEDELEAFRHFQDKIFIMHLKDRAKEPENPDDIGRIIADGTVRYPCPVGSGFIRIKKILESANGLPVIVELYDYSPEHMLEGIRKSIKWLSAER